jgi:hypothetical protein
MLIKKPQRRRERRVREREDSLEIGLLSKLDKVLVFGNYQGFIHIQYEYFS